MLVDPGAERKGDQHMSQNRDTATTGIAPWLSFNRSDTTNISAGAANTAHDIDHRCMS